jgi:hypothetical protein
MSPYLEALLWAALALALAWVAFMVGDALAGL